MTKTVLISAGPTRERIDAVRFISNRSSGKMGYALAAAARELGLEVTLVSGPAALEPPPGVTLERVESAAGMAEAMKRHFPQADLTIMAAAVADYTPVIVHDRKMKKQPGNLMLELKRTEDILQTLGSRKRPGQRLAGFAAETDDLEENARRKLAAKNLDWIIANDVSANDRGFGTDANAVTVFYRDGRKRDLPLASKREIAAAILAILLE